MNNLRKIAVITGTRAEYGLLFWILENLNNSIEIELQILVTGMHLSPEFGLTYKQIEYDGFTINKKIEMILSSDTTIGISKSIGLGVISFSEAFQELKPDIILVLGDRFEIFAAATAGMISRIPIAHIHGGEATEGCIDEAIRHSITKMSQIHFTATEEYKRRVIQLGEQPKNVHYTGTPGIDNIYNLKLLNKNDLFKKLEIDQTKNVFLVTFHPVTLENNSSENQFKELLKALNNYGNYQIIFTLPNADTDGRIIIKLIDEYIKNHNNAKAFISLGQLKYLSLLKYVSAVIGNSSSGLTEVPSFKKATINIGDRQKGRIKASSVIDCNPNSKSIINSIEKALSIDFQNNLNNTVNPYGEGGASFKIVEILKTIDLKNILKKNFYNT